MSGNEAIVIDAHQHFWRTALQEQPWRTPEHYILERDFEMDDLVVELDQAGIDGSVLMQSVDEPAENDRLAHYAAHPRIAGVIAWLPIRDAAASRLELDRVKIPKLAGVRCLVGSDRLEWLNDPGTTSLFRGLAERHLAWDVVPITREQIDAVLRLANSVPELRIVVDHLGRPPIETRGWNPWAVQVAELAACPNVAIKVSVGIDALTTWAAWDPGELVAYIDHVGGLFGPERMMLASNWPVILLQADYQTAWSDLSDLVLGEQPTPEARSAILGGTAARWYRLKTPRTDDHQEVPR